MRRSVSSLETEFMRRRVHTSADEVLFDEYRRGSEAAFTSLFDRHKEPLYTFCLRMLGDAYRAGDAFQETFIRVVKYQKSYQSNKPFRAWLYTIARNVCSTSYHGERIHESLDDIANDAEIAALPESLDVTERDLLAEALGKLSPAAREALLLYEYEGFSYDEIASITGCGLSSVKVRIHRARNQLRIMLRPWLRESNSNTRNEL